MAAAGPAPCSRLASACCSRDSTRSQPRDWGLPPLGRGVSPLRSQGAPFRPCRARGGRPGVGSGRHACPHPEAGPADKGQRGAGRPPGSAQAGQGRLWGRQVTREQAPAGALGAHQQPAAPSVRPAAAAGPRDRGAFTARLFACGAVLGPLLDGIHGTVHLLQYDVGAYDAGGLHSSLVVPALLGTFYAVVGNLFTLGDDLALSGRAGQGAAGLTAELQERASLPGVALATGALALLLELSAVLYARGLPPAGIAATLGAAAALNATAFDRTPQGLALAALCAVSAPLSEVALITLFGVWHYPQGDALLWGVPFPSWVPCCYFFYTPALGALARYLWRTEGQQ